MGVRVGGGIGPVRGSVRVGVPQGANRAFNGALAMIFIAPVYYGFLLMWWLGKLMFWSGPAWCVRRWRARGAGTP